MNFEWDEPKSEACFEERGFDFAYAAKAFFDPDRLIQADTRHSYGEARYQLTGKIEQRLFVAVHTKTLHTKTWRYPHHLGSQGQLTRG
ncbi:MAG: BrnT family toxin [Sterolibacterium sp.]|jgi:uncharacterized DUF497 family protein|nr:BrnT family toxin [Sterolibacterium sp.]